MIAYKLMEEAVRFKSILFLTFLSLPAVAQTKVSAVVNAASSAAPGLPNASIAQGSMFVAYGSGMGAAQLTLPTSYPLPTSGGLNGTSAKVTVGGQTLDVIMIYASATQIAGVVPSATPTGTGTLSVSYNGQSGSTPITVVPNSFGIFAVNQAGSGPGIITFADNGLAGLAKAANPGETLVIWGTGLGPVSGNEAAGALPGNQPNIPVKVWFGGQPAAIAYQGRSGCCAGLDQIAIVVPANVTGCNVPVYVQIGNTVSNPVTTAAAASGRTCTDASGLTSTTYQQLFSNSTLNFGSVSLSRTISTSAGVGGFGATSTKTDEGSAAFLKISVPQGGLLGLIGSTTIGACTITTFSGQSTSVYGTYTYTGLDAGPSIAVSGPAGSRTLTPIPSLAGFYSATLGDTTPGNYLDPGTYTVSGGGGAGVGSFSTSLTLPPTLTWTNQTSASTVTRASGQAITWTGGDPTGYVTITGSSFAVVGSSGVGASFSCQAPTSAGNFTIPAYVLLSLPASSSTGGFAIPGSLSVGTSSALKQFTATGIDIGYAQSSVSISQSATYQ
jgi:uncharacterized protein (TIGR03437 family)